MSPKHYLELLLLAAIWGASFLFMRISAPEFGALNVAGIRVLVAAVTLLPLLFWVGRKYLKNQSLKPALLGHITLVSLGNSVLPFVLFGYAAMNIDAGLASIINATTPLWGAIFSILILSLALSKLAWLGIVIGFVGVAILSSHKLQGGLSSDVFAILAVIGATSLYGVSANYSKRFLVGVPPLLIASSTMAIGALFCIPMIMLAGDPLSGISSDAWIALITLGALSTGIAYVLFYRLIEHVGPTKAMMVTYLIPLFGVMFGHMFLQEQLYINMLAGGVLILIGVMLTTGLIKRRKT